MPIATGHVKVSATEVPAFRRLVQFLEAVETLARVNADPELQELVQNCRLDLERMCRGRG